MSKTYHSYRAWGEYRKERARLKDFEDWKAEAVQDMEDAVTEPYDLDDFAADQPEFTTIYAIRSEWSDDEADYHEDEHYCVDRNKVWEYFADKAEDLGIALNPNQTAFDFVQGQYVDHYSIIEIEVEI